MIKNHYQNKITFLLSAAKVEQLPPDYGAEAAFIGRSNAGKSSAINAIASSKSLARTGKSPGVTQLINVFKIDNERRLIDLPGYGFAKASHKQRQYWSRLISNYLEKRRSLRGLFLLMDIRHPLRDVDQDLLQWSEEVQLPVCILLTKADKLSLGAAKIILQNTSNELQAHKDRVKLHLFSAKNYLGLKEVLEQLEVWLSP